MLEPHPSATPTRYIHTERGGFVDTATIYLSADGKTAELLEWSENLGRFNFRNAQKACSDLGEGFRAITPHEFVGIVNYDKEGPATDAPGMDSGWYWTNQVDASSPSDLAVYVSLRLGLVCWSYQRGSGLVRAVRRVPASQFGILAL